MEKHASHDNDIKYFEASLLSVRLHLLLAPLFFFFFYSAAYSSSQPFSPARYIMSGSRPPSASHAHGGLNRENPAQYNLAGPLPGASSHALRLLNQDTLAQDIPIRLPISTNAHAIDVLQRESGEIISLIRQNQIRDACLPVTAESCNASLEYLQQLTGKLKSVEDHITAIKDSGAETHPLATYLTQMAQQATISLSRARQAVIGFQTPGCDIQSQLGPSGPNIRDQSYQSLPAPSSSSLGQSGAGNLTGTTGNNAPPAIPMATHIPNAAVAPISAQLPQSLASQSHPTPTIASRYPATFPNTKYTHIISVDGSPFELSCYICGATGMTKYAYFKGVRGYRSHLLLHESEVHVDIVKMLKKAADKACLRRVSHEDTLRIQQGQEPAGLQPAVASTVARATRVSSMITDAGRSAPAAPNQYDQLDGERFPTVVFLDNAWTEVWCHICGANMNLDGRLAHFYKGFNGLGRHYKYCLKKNSGEGPSKFDYLDVAKVCGRRILSAEDVGLIKDGKEPQTKIFKYSKFGDHVDAEEARRSRIAAAKGLARQG